MIIAVNIFVLILMIMCYVIYNLYTKNVKLEDAILKREMLFIAISDLVKSSEKKLKEVDRLGAFASDDEIGFFFNTVKEIQEQLNDFKI